MKKFFTICATLFFTLGLGLMLTACGGGVSESFRDYAKSKGVSTIFNTMKYESISDNERLIAYFTFDKNDNSQQFSVRQDKAVGSQTVVKQWYLKNDTIYYSNSQTNQKKQMAFYEDEWQDINFLFDIHRDAFPYVNSEIKEMEKIGNENSLKKVVEDDEVNFEISLKDLTKKKTINVKFINKKIASITNNIEEYSVGNRKITISTYSSEINFPSFADYEDGSIITKDDFLNYISGKENNFTSTGYSIYSKGNFEFNAQVAIEGVSKVAYLTVSDSTTAGVSNEEIWFENGFLYYQYDESQLTHKIFNEYESIASGNNSPIQRAKQTLEKALCYKLGSLNVDFENFDIAEYINIYSIAHPYAVLKIQRERTDNTKVFTLTFTENGQVLKNVITFVNDELAKFESYNRENVLLLSISPLTGRVPTLMNTAGFDKVEE